MQRYEAFALAWDSGAWWPARPEAQTREELGLTHPEIPKQTH